MAERNPPRLTSAEGRKFAIPVGVAFLLIGALGWWRNLDLLLFGAGSIGGVLLLAGLVIPARLGPVYRGWMGFAAVLGRITNPIVMSLMYYLVVTPIGIMRRLMGKNALVHRERDGSYWIDRPADERRSDLTRQF